MGNQSGRSATNFPRPTAIRVLIADPQRLFAEALGAALGHKSNIEIEPAYPTSGLETIEVAVRRRPDVALIDYWMPDMEGQAAAGMILARQPERKIIILSWFHGTREVENSFAAGAVGFLPKSSGLDGVYEAIHRAHMGENPVFPERIKGLRAKLLERSAESVEIGRRLSDLSLREIQILSLLSAHMSGDEVARQLGISPKTVKAHIRNILGKTGAYTAREVVSMAVMCGLIRP